MVPNNSNLIIVYNSILKTLSTIIDELLKMSFQKKDFITNQDWDGLSKLVYDQEELNEQLNIIINQLNDEKFISFKNNDNEKIKSEKKEIKQKLIKFKEMENLNKKLLKDAFYIAKKKAEIYFNAPINDETYKKELKKELNIWGNSSVLLDRTI